MLKNDIEYFREEEAKPIMKQIMNGFQTLKEMQVSHRDIKLANILKHGEQIKIGDFGTAKMGYNG